MPLYFFPVIQNLEAISSVLHQSERRRNYPADCLIDSIVPLSALTLITGDEEGFAKVIEPLTNYLYNKNKFGKQKVKVLLVTINGEFEHIEITLLDKNAVIE